jgi:hypothetical protein
MAVWRVDDAKFWFSGEGSRPPKLRGQTWKSSKALSRLPARGRAVGGGGRDVMLGVQYTRRNRGKHSSEEGKACGN